MALELSCAEALTRVPMEEPNVPYKPNKLEQEHKSATRKHRSGAKNAGVEKVTDKEMLKPIRRTHDENSDEKYEDDDPNKAPTQQTQ